MVQVSLEKWDCNQAVLCMLDRGFLAHFYLCLAGTTHFRWVEMIRVLNPNIYKSWCLTP